MMVPFFLKKAKLGNAMEEAVLNDPLAREHIESSPGKKKKGNKSKATKESKLGFNSTGEYSGADLQGEKLGGIARTDDGVIGFGHVATGDEIGASTETAGVAIDFADGEFIAAPVGETPTEEKARKAKEAAARAEKQRLADEAAAAEAAQQEADRVAADTAAQEAAAVAAKVEKEEKARKMAEALEKDKAKMAAKMKVMHGQKEAEAAAKETSLKAAAAKVQKVSTDAHFAEMKREEKEQSDMLAAARKEKDEAIQKVDKEELDNAAKSEQIKDGTAAVAHKTAIGDTGEKVMARKQSIQIDEKYKAKQELAAKAEQLRKEAEERAEKASAAHEIGAEAYKAEMDRIQKERDDAAAKLQAEKDAAAAKAQADIDEHLALHAAELEKHGALAAPEEADDSAAATAASAARAAEAALLVAAAE